MPQLRASVAKGEIGWTKAREVVKVASPANELRWIAEANKEAGEIAETGVSKDLFY